MICKPQPTTYHITLTRRGVKLVQRGYKTVEMTLPELNAAFERAGNPYDEPRHSALCDAIIFLINARPEMARKHGYKNV